MTLRSWVPGADGSGFPVEHLPYGVFSPADGPPRVGVRIGDRVLDLAALAEGGLLLDPGTATFAQPTLNAFLAAGPEAWRATGERLVELVCDTGARERVGAALWPLDEVRLHLPVEVADYVDFYSSLHHATNLGRLFRPQGDPLLPNWRHLPVGYHGRAGTIVVSGTPVVRPSGQRLDGDVVTFGPSRRLDFELEVGFVIGTPSVPGRPVRVTDAPDHVFGVVLVNDWSARDIQAWEYQPLGPFLGKSFATTTSAWVTPLAALEACRVPGPPQEPEPLPHLRAAEPWGLDLDLAVDLRPAGAPMATTISRVGFADLYWQFPQQIAHLTSNGAHLRTGDLLASGTVSGPDPGTEGSLIELSRAGERPIVVAGEERSFLADGDEVVLRAAARVADGATLTLGEAAGRVVPAR